MRTYKSVMKDLSGHPLLSDKGARFSATKTPGKKGRWSYFLSVSLSDVKVAGRVLHYLKHRGWSCIMKKRWCNFSIKISSKGLIPPSVSETIL